jgi:hypothetical protein
VRQYPRCVTMDAKDLNRALRATLWRALKAHDFTERTERVAWRYSGDDIDVVELQAVGQNAEAVGCPPLSLSVYVAGFPRFLERQHWIPLRNGRLRPHYWDCDPFRRAMEKTLAQPWFRPFSERRDDRMSASFRLHRDALKRLVDPKVHDRADIWYMRDDGSNLDENLRDLTEVVLSEGLDLMDQLHDPIRVLELIDDGSLTSPTSPKAFEMRQTIEEYLAGSPSTEEP